MDEGGGIGAENRLRGWEVRIDRRAWVGDWGAKTKNSAFANELQGCWIWVMETQLGQGKLGFEGWEAGIYRRARVGDLGAKI